MSNPVDIKIAHINKNENSSKSINKDKVHEIFQQNINEKLKLFFPSDALIDKNSH